MYQLVKNLQVSRFEWNYHIFWDMIVFNVNWEPRELNGGKQLRAEIPCTIYKRHRYDYYPNTGRLIAVNPPPGTANKLDRNVRAGRLHDEILNHLNSLKCNCKHENKRNK